MLEIEIKSLILNHLSDDVVEQICAQRGKNNKRADTIEREVKTTWLLALLDVVATIKRETNFREMSDRA